MGTDTLDFSTIELIADADGERLDGYVAAHTQLSRTAVRRLIECGDLTLNGREAKPSSRVKAGDAVEVTLPPPSITEITPENIPINIVYQDTAVAVINKPQGMVVHPAAGNPNGTLVNALMFHIHDLSGVGGELRPGIVHRIDKLTSGLLVVAKNDAAHAALSAQLKTHSVSRIYYALCVGNFREDSGTVDKPIARSRADRKRMAVDPLGRSAITHYEVLERFSDYTLLRVVLETGRTHQIRVHMAYIKHPIVGDAVYGQAKNRLGFDGQALHAGELSFLHPTTGERMTFFAPLPDYYIAALKKLGSRRVDELVSGSGHAEGSGHADASS